MVSVRNQLLRAGLSKSGVLMNRVYTDSSEDRGQFHIKWKGRIMENHTTNDKASDWNNSQKPITLMRYFELLLKNRSELSELLRDNARQPEALQKLLAISLIGFAVYATITGAVLHLGDTNLTRFGWTSLLVSYTVGPIATLGICLPSFYFYALLAGVQASALQIAVQAVRAIAVTSVLLLGIMPVYLFVVVGLYIIKGPADDMFVLSLTSGFILPVFAGCYGVVTFYRGFVDLASTLPSQRRRTRARFLSGMAIAQSGLYAFVMPVMIYTLLDSLSRLTH